MPEMKTLGGYEVVDAKAREEIQGLRDEGHALKSEIPTKVSQLENDSKFITREDIPSEYITESELNAKGYVTAKDVPEAVDTSNLLKYTTVEDQYNWYIATTNKYQVIQNDMPVEKTDTDLDRVINGKTLNNNTIAVREGLQLRVPETPTKDGHAVSKKYVDTKIAAIPIPDLSGYALKTSIPTKVSQLANDSNYLTTIPSEYITEADLNAKGYLTSVPSEFITENELNSKGYLTQHQSLQGYATEAYVVTEIAKAKLEGEDVDLRGFATKDDLRGFITEIPSEYVTDTELNAKGYITDVSNLAPKSSIPTKVSQLSNDKGYLTAIPSEYVTDTDLENKGYLTQHQSLADYAKKSEIPDVSKFITSIPSEYVTESELTAKGYATGGYVDAKVAGIVIPDLTPYAKKTDIPDVSAYQTAAQVQALINEALGVIENGSY